MGRKERKRERERGGEEEVGIDLRERKENVFFYFRVFFIIIRKHGIFLVLLDSKG